MTSPTNIKYTDKFSLHHSHCHKLTMNSKTDSTSVKPITKASDAQIQSLLSKARYFPTKGTPSPKPGSSKESIPWESEYYTESEPEASSEEDNSDQGNTSTKKSPSSKNPPKLTRFKTLPKPNSDKQYILDYFKEIITNPDLIPPIRSAPRTSHPLSTYLQIIGPSIKKIFLATNYLNWLKQHHELRTPPDCFNIPLSPPTFIDSPVFQTAWKLFLRNLSTNILTHTIDLVSEHLDRLLIDTLSNIHLIFTSYTETDILPIIWHLILSTYETTNLPPFQPLNTTQDTHDPKNDQKIPSLLTLQLPKKSSYPRKTENFAAKRPKPPTARPKRQKGMITPNNKPR